MGRKNGPTTPRMPRHPSEADNRKRVCRCDAGGQASGGGGSEKDDDDDVFYLFLQKQKIGAELHIYLEEGTYHKRLLKTQGSGGSTKLRFSTS